MAHICAVYNVTFKSIHAHALYPQSDHIQMLKKLRIQGVLFCGRYHCLRLYSVGWWGGQMNDERERIRMEAAVK
jgi:hypothetical protein